MEDGEIDFSNQDVFSRPSMEMGLGDCDDGCSMGSFFEDLFVKDIHSQSCTHTHTCNPPAGPDLAHTHTCFHVHTKILSSADPNNDDDAAATTGEEESSSINEQQKKKRPLGNKEAVRKYREKKKARAASLEDEVVHLRAMNHQLMKKLQGQAALEAEVARLKCLLVDIRGRIEGEIGSFPYTNKPPPSSSVLQHQQPLTGGGFALNSCNLEQCDNEQLQCFRPSDKSVQEDVPLHNNGGLSQGFGVCDVPAVQCGNPLIVGSSKEVGGCAYGNPLPAVVPSTSRRRRTRGTDG
ncbi:hypothetical protein AMTRI_Chr09g38720 [Amborella trichopoda]|uniref:BZIP domain-containing protein n=1 Tax=Amborella trichopoda TaxID=13333 RepID=W1PKC1_AMBTC|nr:basic leucine zipper 19 [Amborella trichopoda]ERN08483.1 hypothetical protein AMTR_s00152p00031760 [Amborella trichopoda]|eukprot:XP_006846902.1 basic leucine zipper 19 [Amborella trichopoda]